MSSFSTFAGYIFSAAIGFVIFYFVTKAAVRNGIVEAQKERNGPGINEKIRVEDTVLTAKQCQLKEKYERGEISFEIYQAEWNK